MTTPTATPISPRCDKQQRFPSLGCTRDLGHAGACWITSSPDKARAALRQAGVLPGRSR